MSRYAHVIGWGMDAPVKVMTNHDLAEFVDTNDEWIFSRTGIRQRHIAGEGESTASLAAGAAMRALDSTPLNPSDIELIIVASATPDHVFPATACLVQDRIGAVNAGAFDLSAACSGFIFALNMATQSIRSGSLNNALVIGAETLSRVVNWEDRTTCVLFGDGAGAFVLQASNTPGGVLSCVMGSDGSGADLLSIPSSGALLAPTPEVISKKLHKLQMNGREVFRFATRVMASATRGAIQKAKLEIEDIDLVVPHQANQRIIESAARGLKLPMEKFMVNISDYGNTSSASIPIAVCEAFETDRIHPGDNLVLVGFGAGLTWGALTLQWVEPHQVVPRLQKIARRTGTFIWRVRSFMRRVLRKLEGLIWGANTGKKKK
jgi:3-oxoacyl-[acyl-carrier-protein] synthase III